MSSFRFRYVLICIALPLIAAQAAEPQNATTAPPGEPESGSVAEPGSQMPSNATTCPTTSTSTAQTVSKFGISDSGDSQLVTGEIAETVFPILLGGNILSKDDPAASLSPGQGVGLHITAAAPVQNATFNDYARQELLGRNTGLLNGYISLFAGRKTPPGSRCAYAWGARKSSLDHIYFALTGWHLPKRVAKSDSSDSMQPDQGLLFLSHGLGPRAIKTSLMGTGELAAAGTAYVGLGIDGPLFEVGSSGVENAGGLSLEVYASANYMNHGALEKMFNIAAAPSAFYTAGVSLRAYLNTRFSINLDYGKGLGSFGRSALKEATILSFGYNTNTPSSGTSK